LKGDDSYANSASLLAIHSAISYADALRVGLGDLRLASEDHRSSVESLQRLLAERRFEDMSGIKNLRDLVSRKSQVAYGDERLNFRASALLATKAERFAIWANRVGFSLKIEGWRPR
jgi:hypothetical protein